MIPRTCSILSSPSMLHRALDIIHTSLIWAALFQYLIFYFGNAAMIDYITWCVFGYIPMFSQSRLLIPFPSRGTGISQYVLFSAVSNITLLTVYQLTVAFTVRLPKSFRSFRSSFNHKSDPKIGCAYLPRTLVCHPAIYPPFVAPAADSVFVLLSFLAHRIWRRECR